jgi:cytochrome c biogenesis protein CcmG/thiol:disulfide interchange protein DsbE
MTNTPAFQSDDPHDVPTAKRTNYLMWIFIIGVVAMLAAMLLLLLPRGGGDRGRFGTAHPSVGKAPAEWQLEPLTGDPPAIGLSDLKGKVTLVNFWGTWCPPCQVEFPHIARLWEELRGNPGFQLAAVSCEPGIEKDIDGLRETTARFLENAKTEMPTYYDPQGVSRLVTMDVTDEDLAYPTTILFGRDGKVRAYWRGFMPGMEKEVDQAVRAALAE